MKAQDELKKRVGYKSIDDYVTSGMVSKVHSSGLSPQSWFHFGQAETRMPALFVRVRRACH